MSFAVTIEGKHSKKIHGIFKRIKNAKDTAKQLSYIFKNDRIMVYVAYCSYTFDQKLGRPQFDIDLPEEFNPKNL